MPSTPFSKSKTDFPPLTSVEAKLHPADPAVKKKKKMCQYNFYISYFFCNIKFFSFSHLQPE